jgi:hypothetical protein
MDHKIYRVLGAGFANRSFSGGWVLGAGCSMMRDNIIKLDVKN